MSRSPDKQTFVIRPFNGRRCRDGSVLGSDDVTAASRCRDSLLSHISRHSFRRASTFWTWTGNLCVGVSSGVPSGCNQRSKAAGLACRISSPSGPARLEENGTLKERWTVESKGLVGDMAADPSGRFMEGGTGISIFGGPGRDIPKPIGAIFSHPCLADPVIFPSLCMMGPMLTSGDVLAHD